MKGDVELIAVKDSEKPKIVQSISSVIQALPPEQGVEPIHVSDSGMTRAASLISCRLL